MLFGKKSSFFCVFFLIVFLAQSFLSVAQAKRGRMRNSFALSTAANKCDIDEATDLLKKRLDVNWPDRQGNTPLMLAAANGCLEVVLMLLEKGADVNERNVGGKTALMLADEAPINSEAIVSAITKAGGMSAQDVI